MIDAESVQIQIFLLASRDEYLSFACEFLKLTGLGLFIRLPLFDA